MKRYKTLDEILREQKEWGIYSIISKLLPIERTSNLGAIFRTVAEVGADDSAERNFELLMRALDDVILVPLLKKDCGPLSALPYSEEVDAAEKEAAKSRGFETAQLFQALFCEGPQTPFLPALPEKILPLPKTKKAMFLEIVRDWGTVADEEDADSLCRSVLGFRLRYPDEELCLEALREGTGRGFPTPRLIRGINYLNGEGFCGNLAKKMEMGRILEIAWVRNSDARKVAQILGATESMTGVNSSNEAYILLKQTAGLIADLEKRANALKQAMENTPVWEERVCGGVYLSFPALSEVRVKIVVKFGTRERVDENMAHSVFEKARRHVRTWKAENPGIRVYLELEAFQSYSKEPYVKREETF